MARTIAMPGVSPAERPGGIRFRRRLQALLRRIGIRPLLWLGLGAELCWSLFASLMLGVGTHPADRAGYAAQLWLGGTIAIAVLFGFVARRAVPPPGQR